MPGRQGQTEQLDWNLAETRRKEIAASARLFGAQLYIAGVPDGTLIDDVRTRRVLIEIFRRFKPSLVLAHAPEDYHPDHRAASALAEAVSWFCASRGHKTKSPALPASPELWWMDTMDMSSFSPGFYVDISAYLEIKMEMLACHRSQLARGEESDFAPLMELMRLQSRARGMQAGVEAAEAFRSHCTFKRARAW